MGLYCLTLLSHYPMGLYCLTLLSRYPMGLYCLTLLSRYPMAMSVLFNPLISLSYGHVCTL